VSGNGKFFSCRGANYVVTLTPKQICLRETGLDPKNYELPIERISSVVVRRKTIIPFVSLITFASAAAIMANFNALWFIVPLSPLESSEVTIIALLIAGLAALPAAVRAWFVSVTITWDGRPRSFIVRLVPGRRGRRLARLFHELSTSARS